ncbi:hypothetical protein EW146_g4000 [Bondarzewia mesenterica]|uniref:Steroid 5-alpha reductase C-terminal domain-containing protein n=1 Tax=Bondarzewia mesenterica TaxID=1095465 RepID=A0A4S4M1N6_9AGAM|nr:hypothetical protein EW146_g4000 [Bondarzewia mesenterica]
MSPTISDIFQQSFLPTFQYPLKFCAASTLTTYILSLFTGNVSQVDRLWTFLPTIYTAYWALLPIWPRGNRGPAWLVPYVPEEVSNDLVQAFSPRAVLMFGLVVSAHFPYSLHGQLVLVDVQAVLQYLEARPFQPLFNLTFIAITQNILLLLLGVPTHRALTNPTPLIATDAVLTLTALTLLALEFTADNQQFAYQTFKHATTAYDSRAQWPGARFDWTEADKKRGFVTRGLWAWSRHPNFWCEQSFWVRLRLPSSQSILFLTHAIS